jgi:hypothetical protein
VTLDQQLGGFFMTGGVGGGGPIKPYDYHEDYKDPMAQIRKEANALLDSKVRERGRHDSRTVRDLLQQVNKEGMTPEKLKEWATEQKEDFDYQSAHQDTQQALCKICGVKWR